MRSRKSLIWTAILAFSLIGAGTALGSGPIFGAGSVDFIAEPGGAGVLEVAGPGGYHFRQSFKAGEVASMSLFDGAGNLLVDGTYNWQITSEGVAASDRAGFSARVEPQSGAFTITSGAVADPGALEGGSTKDQVILDDLIVDGSICVGQDCVNGESFGFDTSRLQETTLRVRAVDASATARLPTRDWQLTFNDSSNGGANKFSIDDIDGGRTPFTIEAGAPSHSLYVDDGGRIGFGTSTPVADLHVKSGNTPTLRLEQDGSSGFTPQTWDVAGNEANLFIRDATNGSTLPFRIFPGAPSNALAIEGTTGDVGLGTTSPGTLSDGSATQASMHILRSDGDASLKIEDTSSTDASRLMMELENNGDIFFRLNDSGGDAMDINFAANEFRVNLTSSLGPEMTLDANGVMNLTSDCIELATFACTAANGSFTCVTGSC